jgi:hypothetical protein
VQERITIRCRSTLRLSHAFVERLIATIRRESLEQSLFWSGGDLKGKLENFRQHYNAHRARSCSAAIHRQKSAVHPPFAALISTSAGGNLVVAGCISCLLQSDQQFARHRN